MKNHDSPESRLCLPLYPDTRPFRPFGMLPRDTFQQHGQLCGRQMHFPFPGHRLDEASPLKTLGEQA